MEFAIGTWAGATVVGTHFHSVVALDSAPLQLISTILGNHSIGATCLSGRNHCSFLPSPFDSARL